MQVIENYRQLCTPDDGRAPDSCSSLSKPGHYGVPA